MIPREDRAEDNRAYGAFNNGALTSSELENIRKVFALYVTFPKNRWSEIKQAETDDAVFKKIMNEYKDQNLLERQNRVAGDTEKDKITANEIFINDEEAIAI